MTQSAPFYLYKGDDTHFDGANVIQFVVNSTADLSRFSGYFQLGEFKQITNLTNGVMRVEIPRSYTGNFLFGPMRGVFRLVDKLGRIKTVFNDLEFYITDDISLLGQNQSIEVTGVDYQVLVEVNLPLTNYNDLNDKPTINGVTVQGDKTDNDYGIQHELTPASNMDITNNVISAKVDDELKDDSELPVQNKVVKGALDEVGGNLSAHVQNKNNPHEVTKAQVGLGQVDNTADIDKPVSTAQQAAIDAHANRTDNPHSVTKAQVGLGNVDNTSDADKPISTAQQTAFNNKQDKLTQTQLDAVNSGADAAKIATIGQNTQAIGVIEGKIPSQASEQNQLADKGFVNSTVQTSTAHFRGSWETYAAIPTDGNLYPADEFGVREPGPNDYLVVRADETRDGGTWRYKYTGTWATNGKNGWEIEYEVNETPLTAAQLASLNSGVTSNLVTQISTNANNITSLQNGKQDIISDLSSIRSGASAGASALQPDTAASTYATKSALTSGLNQKQDVLPAGTTGYFLKKTASGVEWAQVAGGSSDYADLSNKPSINSVTLSGNKTSTELGVANVDLSNLTSEAKPNIIDTLSDIYNTVSYTVVGAPTISNGIASGFSADDYVKIPTSLTFSGASDIEFDIEFTTPSSLASATYPIIGCDSIWTSPLLYIESGSSLLFDGVGYAGYSNIQTDTTYRANIKIKDNSGTIVLYGSDGTVIGQHTQSTSFAEKTVTLLFGAPYGNNSNVVKNININKTSIKVNGEYLFIGKTQEIKPAHLAMPSDVTEDLTVVQGTIYTAPADGYLQIATSGTCNISTHVANATVTDWTTIILNTYLTSGSNNRTFIPVRKGQKFSSEWTGTLQHFYFVYAKGSETEYQGA